MTTRPDRAPCRIPRERRRKAAFLLAFGWAVLPLMVGAAEEASTSAPVADAAEAGFWDAMKTLVSLGTDPNPAQADGMTALHWAAHHRQSESVAVLLKAGANAGAPNRYGVTPLSIACAAGDGEIVDALLAAGADPRADANGGEAALVTAARNGGTEPIRALVAHGAEVDAAGQRNQTALMWAAAEGHADAVRILIEAGADPSARSSSGFTPMFFAAREGRREVARTLLDAGVDINAALEDERRGGRAPRPGTSALVLAVENGHFDLAVDLLEAGADPNDQRSGFAPLHVLTWVRKPNRGDGDDGLPPPIGSGDRGSLDMVRELVNHGADVNLRLARGSSGPGNLGTKGATAFLLAAKTADLPMLRLLVELGADPLIANDDGSTPLMAAAGLGTLAPTEEAGTEDEALATVAFLLELGAQVNTVDKNRETAMHGAAYKSLPRMVGFLAANGANIETWNRKNKRGWTPLLIAQGFRPGNFKPSVETIEAISEVMLAAGITPPDPPPRDEEKRKGY